MLPVCKLPQNSIVFYIILVLFYFVNVASLQVATWQQWKRTSVCPRLLFRSVSPWWTRDLKKHDRNIKEVNTLFHIYGTLAKYIINLIQQMAKKQIKSNSFHKPYPTNSIAFRTRRPTAPRACLVTKDKWLVNSVHHPPSNGDTTGSFRKNDKSKMFVKILIFTKIKFSQLF